MKKAVCIISGGMDSAVAARIAKDEGYGIVAVHFNYGQRTEARELEAFRAVSDSLEVLQKYEIDLPFFKNIGGSALTDKSIAVPIGGIKEGVPVTYVPFRNGIFLSIATAIAEKEDAKAIVIGAVEEDSSGYPDCTESFLSSFEACANEGTKQETVIKIFAPLLHKYKKEIVVEGINRGVDLSLTWSCYQNEQIACGVCDSCRLRLRGFEEAGVEDKIPYKTVYG
jgi:7-cyano-7-deazaguanine synthase